jgi:hypothetical protein
MDYECTNKKGVTVAKFRTISSINCKLDTGFIRLPSKVVIDLFDEDGTPIRTDSLEVGNFIMGKELQANDVHISASLATTIWDKQNDVWIKVRP